MFVALDLEIAKQIPSKYILTNMVTRRRSNAIFDSEEQAEKVRRKEINPSQWRVDSIPDDFMSHWPLGISVAATAFPPPNKPVAWYSVSGDTPAGQMDNVDAQALVNYMQKALEQDNQIVTWNGLRFDYHVMAHESGKHAECAEMALNHVDLMFIIFCHKGFYAKLDNCARSMLGEQKTEGVDGAYAPELWAKAQYDTVIEYVSQDVSLTAKLAQKIAETGVIEWTASSSGKLHSINVAHLIKDGRLPTVMECLELAEPDTSWMDNPPQRSDFFEWMDKKSQFIPF